jgi:hypothetical protein
MVSYVPLLLLAWNRRQKTPKVTDVSTPEQA